MAQTRDYTQTLTFAATVDAWVKESKERLRQVFQMSAQDVIEEMQRVGPSKAATRAAIRDQAKGEFGPVRATGEGGRMPVDTGFLRASLQVSLDGVRPANQDNPGGNAYAYTSEAAALTILGAEVGDTVYASYTASYAPHVNYGTEHMMGYHFVDLAAQRWPQIVAANVQRVKAGGGGGG